MWYIRNANCPSQLLAWNGGGSTNYSDIVSEGGHKVSSIQDRFDGLVEKAEKLLTQELGAIYSEIQDAVVA